MACVGYQTSEGVLSVVPFAPAILARDKVGLYAMTITCTHQGCDVSPHGTTLLLPVPRQPLRQQWRRVERPGGLTARALRGLAGCRRQHHCRRRDAGGCVGYQADPRGHTAAR